MQRVLVLLVAILTVTSSAIAAETAEQILTRAKSVLAQLDGEVKLPGLSQSVEVLRDRWGVPHIYAQNQRDLFFAQGVVAAQDRLFQLDLWRRVAVGETAEVFGEEAIPADQFARLMCYRGDMQAEWISYSPDTQEIASAFAAGINAYIDLVGERLPIEFQILGYRPKKWQPQDILGRMSGVIMVTNWQREVARARLVAEVGVEQARLLAPTDPPREFAPAPSLELSLVPASVLHGYQAATRVLKFSPSSTESNNWVVDGTLSASGKPLLASDPHRPVVLPSLRYLVHLHAPGWNVIGSGEPALPGIALGHNERIAWGFTIVGTDQSDLFVEELNPADPRQYKVNGKWEPIEIVRDSLQVKGRSEPLRFESWFTRHGPVVYLNATKNVAIALKWVGSEPGGAAYLGALAVARANNKDEFLKAIDACKIPSENFVYADVDGNIGWVAAAETPIRKGHDGLLPVPGATDDFEWQGFRPVSELPQKFNPPEHWLATANHNILPPGYPHDIAFEWGAPHRYQRVRDRLTAQPKFTLSDFQAIQHDVVSLPGLALAAILKEVEVPPELASAKKLLTEWDGVLAVDSSAGPLYASWLQELMKFMFGRRMPQDARIDRGDLRSITTLLKHLEQPTQAWFGAEPVKARDEMLRQSLKAAAERVKKLLGNDPAKWQWGQLHQASLEHPLASLGPEYAKAFNLGPVPRPGDVHTPNNTRHDDNFRQLHGASYRQLFDLADWDRGLATSTPGQSGQPGSPHYSDLLPLWAAGQYFPLAYSRAKVEEVTKHRLRLLP